MEQLQAADKVVIARWWFALVDGQMMAGAVTMGGKLVLDTADTLERYRSYIGEIGRVAADGPEAYAQRFLAAARRAELMLGAVTHGEVALNLAAWVDATGVTKNPLLAGMSTTALEAARAFGAGMARGNLER